MARKGKDFENENAWIYGLDCEKYQVTSPAYIFDKTIEKNREVDVLVEYIENGIYRRIGIECRDRRAVQDVMWIEQLKQKKEDLELDAIIATVTSGFTDGAIKKARYHGVILEKAEVQINDVVKRVSEEFFADVYLVKYILETLCFISGKGTMMTFNETLKRMNVFQQREFVKTLNLIILENCNAMDMLQQCKIDATKFFEKEDNSIFIEGNAFFEKNDFSRGIIDNLEISHMTYRMRLLPFRISLPLNHSVSIFDGVDKSNKKYRAFFGTKEEHIDMGYVEDEMYLKIKLKERKHYGYIGMDTHLNTLFPDETGELNVDWDALLKIIPEIDVSRLN